jgi:hypothetical protein
LIAHFKNGLFSHRVDYPCSKPIAPAAPEITHFMKKAPRCKLNLF